MANPDAGCGLPEIRYPFMEWLRANGLEPDTVIDWPLIEYLPVPSPSAAQLLDGLPEPMMRIERLTAPIAIIDGTVCTYMDEVPLKVPMSAFPGLQPAFDHMAPEMRDTRRRKELLAFVARQGATVLTTNAGSTVVVVVKDTGAIPPAALSTLGAALNGAKVFCVAGAEAIVVGNSLTSGQA